MGRITQNNPIEWEYSTVDNDGGDRWCIAYMARSAGQPIGFRLFVHRPPRMPLSVMRSLRDWLTKRIDEIDEIEAAKTARKKPSKPRKPRA